MRIRQHKILTRALLILFIINFALAAPAAVRERPDLDANVRRDVTAASQKRRDPLDEGGSTNVPKAGDAQPPGAPPPSLDSTGRVQRVPVALGAPTARPPGLWLPSAPPPGLRPPSAPPPRLLYPYSRPPRPIMPSPWPLRPLLPAAQPAGLLHPLLPKPDPDPLPSRRPYRLKPYRYRPRPPRPPPPTAPPPTASPPSAPPPPSTPASQPEPSNDHFPRPPGFSANPYTSSSTGSHPQPWEPLDWGSLNVPGLDHVPPPSPAFTDILSQIPHAHSPPTDSLGSSTGSHYVPPSPGPPTGSVGPMPVGSLSPPSPPPLLSHPHEPEPSNDIYPQGFSPKPDTLSSTGSKGNQPIPPRPESPGMDPETHSLLNPETFPTEFWDEFLKGKIKRRISGSDSVGLAQKDPRVLKFPRRLERQSPITGCLSTQNENSG